MEFYEKLADVYDKMTRFQERLPGEKPIMQKWVERFHIRSALDVACGTGLHTVILAQLGVRTMGCDSSAAMVKQARDHAREFGVTAEFIVAPMQTLPDSIPGPFDAIFCLGNSLPHLLTRQDLAITLSNFYQLLNKDGIVIIQNLNYDRIIGHGERVVGANRAGDREFIRFYDFEAPLVKFNVLIIDWAGSQAHYSWETTELYPYQRQEIEQAMRQARFTAMAFYGDMHQGQFDADGSINLVVVGKK